MVDDRTAQLQRSLEVQAKLYEKTRQQVDQLRHMNQLKDEFLSTMSHELRTPLTSMTLAIRMLRQPGLSFDRQQRYLDILEQQCTQETNLINDLLALQKLDSRQTPLQIRKVDLKVLIGDRTIAFETDWSHKNLTLAIDLPDDPLTLYTNFDGLDRILLELLTNAGKYAAPNSTIDLQVRQSDDAVTLQLANLGTAIAPEELPFIFDKFRRGSGITQQAIPGTGLGLALVKSLVSHLNGAIEATSEPQSDGLWRTCLTLTLPKKITRKGEA
ncbi:MAG: HAMP domain-containing histidine kinase [Leptolyngbyaceae cyanobacterium SM1_3_5]|nr:HAMP domain-containing histidine kinase [Leptolyngbyaceae cyanobacterium SM1_3_5]